MSLQLALAEWRVGDRPGHWEAWERRLQTSVETAASRGASLLVYPEYAGLELAGLLPEDQQRDVRQQIAALQEYREAYVQTHQKLAAAHGVTLVAGTFPWKVDGGGFRNRAWVVESDGNCHARDKSMMTRFEKELLHLEGADQEEPVLLPWGKLGITICYDVEFPLLARSLVVRGADLLVTPSCTDTLAGWQRVRTGARARALENQCYVGQAPLVGQAPWNPVIDENTGRAALFTPPDRGFPETGIAAEGDGSGGWVHATLDFDRLHWVRRHGQVFLSHDWEEQKTRALEK